MTTRRWSLDTPVASHSVSEQDERAPPIEVQVLGEEARPRFGEAVCAGLLVSGAPVKVPGVLLSDWTGHTSKCDPLAPLTAHQYQGKDQSERGVHEHQRVGVVRGSWRDEL